MSATTKVTNAKGEKAHGGRRRSVARLAAVQALYEMDMVGASADPVLSGFLRNRWNFAVDDASPPLAEPDDRLLEDLVRGVSERRQELDASIAPVLAKEWTIERLEVVLRAILRAGTYELLVRTDIPPRVVISEYVSVAHAFFAGKEAGLVNGVLDRLARSLREGEMKEDNDGQTTKNG